MIADQTKQKELADKLNHITTRTLAIQSMQEDIDECLVDVQHILKESDIKKSIGDVKLLVKAYIDSVAAKNEEKAKIDKANLTINKIEEAKGELSVLERFRLDNIYDEADKLLEM